MQLTVGQHHVTASAFQGFVIEPGSVVSWTYTVTEPKCSKPVAALNAPPSPDSTVSLAPAQDITNLAETGSRTSNGLMVGFGALALGGSALYLAGWLDRQKGKRR